MEVEGDEQRCVENRKEKQETLSKTSSKNLLAEPSHPTELTATIKWLF